MNKKHLKLSLIGTLLGSTILVTTLTPPIISNQNSNVIANDINFNTNTNNAQTVASVSDIKYELNQNSESVFAIIKDAVNGDRLYGWGLNAKGELGINNKTNQSLPQLCQFINLPAKATINAVYSATNITAVVVNNDQLYLAGSNSNGLQGIGSSDNNITIPVFTKNTTISGQGIIANVALSLNNIFVTINKGSEETPNLEVWSWGLNFSGVVGDGTTIDVLTPKKMEFFPAGKIKKIIVTNHNAYAWIDNQIYAWGAADAGAIGNGNDSDLLKPTLVNIPPGTITNFTANIAYNSSTCMLQLDDKNIYGWGDNFYGELGIETDGIKTPMAITPVSSDLTITNMYAMKSAFGIEAGTKVTENGVEKIINKQLYMSGINTVGQLCDDTTNPRKTFMPIKNYSANDDTIYESNLYGIFATTDGVTHAWGNNQYGTFGIGTNEKINSSPILIDAFSTPTINGFKTTNNEVTATTALNDFWDGITINWTNLVKYIDLPPADTTFSIVAGTTPSANDIKKTITLSLVSNKTGYACPDGQKVLAGLPMELKITGFKAPITTTISKGGRPGGSKYICDQWYDNMKDENGNLDKFKLWYYFDFNVPGSAEFFISDLEPNYTTGALKLKIWVDKVKDSDGNIFDIPSEKFDITLDMLPRLATGIKAKTNYPTDLTVLEFKEKLFDQNNKVKDLVEFQKYAELIVPVSTANYYLSNSADAWVVDVLAGTVTLKVYADKYYDEGGNVQTGSNTNGLFTLTYNLAPSLPSKITLKTDHAKTVRVDKFVNYLKNGGTNLDRARLAEFFTLENIPKAAVFSIIGDPKISDYDEKFIQNKITFDLRTSAFNDASGMPGEKTQTFTLTLGNYYAPTEIIVKTGYDQSLRVDKVANELNTLTGDDLVNYLKDFVTLKSIPSTADVSVRDVEATAATGELTFNVVLNQKYIHSDDQLATGTYTYPISLALGIKHEPTAIVLKDNYKKDIRADRFIDSIKTLAGQPLYNYLANDYITFTSVIDQTKVTADILASNNELGTVRIKVSVPSYYDANSDLVSSEKSVTFDLSLEAKHVPTAIVLKDDYKKDIRVDRFINSIKTLKEQTLYNYLANDYITFTSVIDQTKVTASILASNNELGTVKLKVSVPSYYDANSDLVSSEKSATFDLSLEAKYEPTAIVLKDDYKSDIRVDKFINEISDLSGQNLYDYLATDYVNFTSIVDKSTLTVEIVSSDNDIGIVNLLLSVPSYYDENSELITSSKSFKLDLILARKYTPTSIKTLDVGKYPQDLTPTKFKALIEKDATSNPDGSFNLNHTSITFLSKFLVFSSIPNNTDYTLVWGNDNEVEGTLDFSLVLSQYYNTDGDLILTASDKFALTLNLSSSSITVPKATEIKTKTDSPIVESNDDFMNQIFIAENVINRDALGSFITGLHTVPSTADITLVQHQDTINGILTYTIHISAYYNGIDSDSITEAKSYSFEVKTKDAITDDTKTESQFPWWWILTGIGGVIIIGLLAWLIIKKTKNSGISL